MRLMQEIEYCTNMDDSVTHRCEECTNDGR